MQKPIIMSIEKALETIAEIAQDPKKLAVVFHTLVKSENEDIIRMTNELWILLILSHGDQLSTEFKKIDRIQEQEYQREIAEENQSRYQRAKRNEKDTSPYSEPGFGTG